MIGAGLRRDPVRDRPVILDPPNAWTDYLTKSVLLTKGRARVNIRMRFEREADMRIIDLPRVVAVQKQAGANAFVVLEFDAYRDFIMKISLQNLIYIHIILKKNLTCSPNWLAV